MSARSPGAVWATACALAALVAALGCGAEPPAPAEPVPGEGDSVLHLDAEALARAGIEVAPATPGRLEPELEGYGRVLDPTPVVDAITSREVAAVVLEAAKRERERLEALARGDRNASAREVEAARAAAARAAADLELAGARVVSLLGAAEADGAALGSFGTLAKRLARREVALVRIDVPVGAARPHPELGARLLPAPRGGGDLDVHYLGAASDVDPTLPGWGFLFLVREDPPPVGTPVLARLRGDGETLEGVEVPDSARIWDGGRSFVFVERAAGTFERRAVVARARPGGGLFLSEGVAPGERLVVVGAQQLLSAGRLAASGRDADE